MEVSFYSNRLAAKSCAVALAMAQHLLGTQVEKSREYTRTVWKSSSLLAQQALLLHSLLQCPCTFYIGASDHGSISCFPRLHCVR